MSSEDEKEYIDNVTVIDISESAKHIKIAKIEPKS